MISGNGTRTKGVSLFRSSGQEEVSCGAGVFVFFLWSWYILTSQVAALTSHLRSSTALARLLVRIRVSVFTFRQSSYFGGDWPICLPANTPTPTPRGWPSQQRIRLPLDFFQYAYRVFSLTAVWSRCLESAFRFSRVGTQSPKTDVTLFSFFKSWQ